MTDTIRGDLCVLREGQTNAWLVCLCQGPGKRDVLARFPDPAKAAEYAIAERDRRREWEGLERGIHFPDDCPCYTTIRSLQL